MKDAYKTSAAKIMKSCAYCGRKNSDEALHCCECGTEEFQATTDPTKHDIANENTEASGETLIELQRCYNSESLASLTHTLDFAGIRYQCSSLPELFDIGKIGAAEESQIIVSVPRNLFGAARAAMEIELLQVELPENHHLRTATEEELIEIVSHATEWSAFDVADAKRLIAQKGVDLTKVEDRNAERLRQLHTGQRASKMLIFFGWVFSILGGLIGLLIAWLLISLKEKTPDGDFFTYDEESRAKGRVMLKVAGFIFIVGLVVRWVSWLSH